MQGGIRKPAGPAWQRTATRQGAGSTRARPSSGSSVHVRELARKKPRRVRGGPLIMCVSLEGVTRTDFARGAPIARPLAEHARVVQET
jgi:hypothetical protein